MKLNKVKIRIIAISNKGRNQDLWCDKVLMLRKARQVGDIEVVNHTQLSALNRMKGEVRFEIVKPVNMQISYD